MPPQAGPNAKAGDCEQFRTLQSLDPAVDVGDYYCGGGWGVDGVQSDIELPQQQQQQRAMVLFNCLQSMGVEGDLEDYCCDGVWDLQGLESDIKLSGGVCSQ